MKCIRNLRRRRVLFLALFFMAFTLHAEENISIDDEGELTLAEKDHSGGEVIVEKSYDVTLPYKQRRTSNGVLFSIASEKFYPLDYVSQFRDVYIENIINKNRINLLNIEIGYKRNASVGSLSFLFGYANGKITGSVLNLDRSLDITRQALSLNFALDNIMPEPWIVPYVQGGADIFNVSETSFLLTGKVTKSDSSGLSYNYRAGLLFQLDWIEKSIDPSTQSEGLRSSGLENTFIDLYFSDHTSPDNHYNINSAPGEGKPNLTSGLEMGIGLKLEF